MMGNYLAITFGIRTANRALLYTTADEFCAIFNRDMDSLFSLALVLTGNESRAEQCFSAALEKCRKSTAVFRDWARSYARVAVIEKAIELIAPVSQRPDPGQFVNDLSAKPSRELDLVLRMNSFERFVYVLTILNRFTEQDCAILLKCHPNEVERAQYRAFAFIAANSEALAPVSNGTVSQLAS